VIEQGWKVFRAAKNGDLLSAFAGVSCDETPTERSLRGYGVVHKRNGVWNKPRDGDGPLGVFADRDAVAKFMRYMGSLSPACSFVRLPVDYLPATSMGKISFWNWTGICRTFEVFPGTLLARKVRIRDE
jgi:hypothetical protein